VRLLIGKKTCMLATAKAVAGKGVPALTIQVFTDRKRTTMVATNKGYGCYGDLSLFIT
jgi:hypothetical protein